MINKALQLGLLFNPGYAQTIHADHDDRLHNPRTGFKRLLRKQVREIDVSRATLVHLATQNRARSNESKPDGAYDPENLRQPVELEKHYTVVQTEPGSFQVDFDSAA